MRSMRASIACARRASFGDADRAILHILGLQVRIPLQRGPGIMQGKLRDLLDAVAAFKQAARRLVPQVVEVQIANAENAARARKRRAY